MSATEDDPVGSALLSIESEMRRIDSGSVDPYEAGRRIWSEAFSHAPVSPKVMWPLWLLWGGLTDWIEMKPKEAGLANEAMRRACHEWLTTVTNESSRKAYFEKWLFEELGLKRRDVHHG
jgi:hypothetical protein